MDSVVTKQTSDAQDAILFFTVIEIASRKTSNNISVKTESNTGFIIRPLFFTFTHKDHIFQSRQIQSLWKTVGK